MEDSFVFSIQPMLMEQILVKPPQKSRSSLLLNLELKISVFKSINVNGGSIEEPRTGEEESE